MTQRDYEHGRKLILSRIASAQKLLNQTRPEQVNLRNSLARRIGVDRVQLAKWDMENKPKPAPMDGDFYEGPVRQLDIAA